MLRNLVRYLLDKIGYKIVKVDTYRNLNDRLLNNERSIRLAYMSDFFYTLNVTTDKNKMINYSNYSKSQLLQDLFVITFLDFKMGGFFVEFGATNGIDLSNSYLLEKQFGWVGILAEPSRNWHKELINNRSCFVEKKAVWSNSNQKVKFLQSHSPELSTIDSFKKSDTHLRKGETYEVETISLIDLLAKYDAPDFIDYLSIDTEGSELDILSGFDFNLYKFNIITVEHNYSEKRETINNLLTSNGYNRVLTSISQFDDWYILNNYN